MYEMMVVDYIRRDFISYLTGKGIVIVQDVRDSNTHSTLTIDVGFGKLYDIAFDHYEVGVVHVALSKGVLHLIDKSVYIRLPRYWKGWRTRSIKHAERYMYKCIRQLEHYMIYMKYGIG